MSAPAPPKQANTMADLRRRDFWAVVIGGFLLSAVAGFINAATMIGLFTTTVSHLTGTTTRMAVTIVQGKWDGVLREIMIIFGFAFGSFACGIIVRINKFRMTKRYGYALLIECAALAVTTICLYYENYIAPVIAAFACGLQNGLTSGYSGAIVRTTHVTGTVTDIGLIIGQNLFTETRADLWKLKVLVPLLLGYWLGGFAGTIAYVELDYLCFVIPCVFVGVLGLVQIALHTYYLQQYEKHELELRKARARAKRAARRKHQAVNNPDPTLPLLSETGVALDSTSHITDGSRSTAALLGGSYDSEGSSDALEMREVHDGSASTVDIPGAAHEAHRDHVPLVRQIHEERKKQAALSQYDDDEPGDYDDQP